VDRLGQGARLARAELGMLGLDEALAHAVESGRLSLWERWIEVETEPGLSDADAAIKARVRRLMGRKTVDDYRRLRHERRVRQRREYEARESARGRLPAHQHALAIVAAGSPHDLNARHARLLLSRYKRFLATPRTGTRVCVPRGSRACRPRRRSSGKGSPRATRAGPDDPDPAGRVEARQPIRARGPVA
jgi:hypothetical protein